MDIIEDQSRKEGDTNLDLEEDFIFGIIGKIIGRMSLWRTMRKRRSRMPLGGMSVWKIR